MTQDINPAGLVSVPPSLRLVTPRAIGLACGLMPLLALWVVNSELVWYTGHSTIISLFYHVTFPLFVIGCLNLLVARKFPQSALSSAELMTVYVMLSVAGTLCSHDFIQLLVTFITYPAYAANPQNMWDTILIPLLPKWAIVTDMKACQAMALGNASLYNWDTVQAWWRPFVVWGTFILVLMCSMLFLNILVRRQWTEQERLSFPVIQIPMMITHHLEDLLRNRLFWIAFVITAFIDLMNGLNFLYPSFPRFPTVGAFSFRDYLLERPWDAIAMTEVNLYPFVIGLSFFLPTDLAFSCWFFFVLYKLEMVVAASLGITDLPGFPYVGEQAAGGYLGLAVIALWLSRRHLAMVGRTVLGLQGGLDESGEPIRYRTATIGFLICFMILVCFGYALGASVWVMVLFFILFFLYAVAIARMRAELGPPVHDLHFMGPDTLLLNGLGTRQLGGENIAVFSLFWFFNRAYRAHFSAHCLEGFKVAQLIRVTSRSMMVAILIAVGFGFLCAFWAMLQNFYVYGYCGRAGEGFASEVWMRTVPNLVIPQAPKLGATSATLLGFLFTLILGGLRMRFTWWLWHPVGYATCSSWSMDKLWACIFLGWLARWIITRYGGATAYRRAIPFFVGMVLGEFVTGSLWSIFGGVAQIPVYHFFG